MHCGIITHRINPQWEISNLMYILGTIPQEKCCVSERCAVLRSTWNWTLDQPTAWGSPLWAGTQAALLNVWVSLIRLQKESLRPDTSSSPWNQDQRHEDDFPGSWLTWSCSLHTHTPSPISSLLLIKSCPHWCYLIAERLNKLTEHLSCPCMSVQKSPHLIHTNVHVKYPGNCAFHRTGVHQRQSLCRLGVRPSGVQERGRNQTKPSRGRVMTPPAYALLEGSDGKE